MATQFYEAPVAPSVEAAAPRPDPLGQQVRGLLADWYSSSGQLRRRTRVRYPYPQLILVTPLDGAEHSAGVTFVCCGKDLSPQGIGIFHPQPLASRRVILTFASRSPQSVSILAILDWCRFTRLGWYESGGRLLQVVPSPTAGDA